MSATSPDHLRWSSHGISLKTPMGLTFHYLTEFVKNSDLQVFDNSQQDESETSKEKCFSTASIYDRVLDFRMDPLLKVRK